jgi:hypothetical protein
MHRTHRPRRARSAPKESARPPISAITVRQAASAAGPSKTAAKHARSPSNEPCKGLSGMSARVRRALDVG